jgi:hypothetical protein
VLSFRLILSSRSEQGSQISNAFVRALALESARLGADLPPILTIGEEGPSVRKRYAPMHRLLAQDDELFLKRQGLPAVARRVRHEHRNCYFGYLTRLTREIRTARRLHALAMASQANWSFWTLLAHTVLSESSLLYLRWLGCRHAAGINVAALDIKECLDFLLGGPRFRLATT